METTNWIGGLNLWTYAEVHREPTEATALMKVGCAFANSSLVMDLSSKYATAVLAGTPASAAPSGASAASSGAGARATGGEAAGAVLLLS